MSLAGMRRRLKRRIGPSPAIVVPSLGLCAHCRIESVRDDARKCRHGKLCGKCEHELDVYSGVGDE